MMFQSSTNQNVTQNLNFIDLVQHFVNQVLEQIHNTFTKNNTISECVGYHFITLLFQKIYLANEQMYLTNSKMTKKASMKHLSMISKGCATCMKLHIYELTNMTY
ncbi:hypothetical protein CR513_45069, partial [Mucuna pruriens]